jgi:hypothetical protein
MTSLIIFGVIVLIFYFYLINADEYIEGYWVADDTAFTDKAGITSMMLYIGPKNNTSWFTTKISREIYLVITPDVANQGGTLTYSREWNINKNYYQIKGDSAFDDEESIPNEAIWKFNILKGELVIIKDEKVYAKLYKQNELSDL